MSLYLHHLTTLQQRYSEACRQFGLDSILCHSGSLSYYTNDDLSHPFHPSALTQQWLPYDVAPETWVVFHADGSLELCWPARQDFWHVVPEAPSGDWTKSWKITAGQNHDWVKAYTERSAILTTSPESLSDVARCEINRTDLVHWLNYDRAYKTEWEIEQLRIANQRAVTGHLAAEASFLAGKSEFEIHIDYLMATRQQQVDEPYSAIVALNENAATLHYEHKRMTSPTENRTLLIDAGVKVNGFGSDITRTFTTAPNMFAEILADMEQLQLALVDACTAGTAYQSIQQQTLTGIAGILLKHRICLLPIEEQLEKRIPQVFFPHGIGHLLGLQVHDAGGHQIDRSGEKAPPPDWAPFMRLNRTLQDNMVVTIEPGLYFIPMLLNRMNTEIGHHGCDLALIEQLKPFGGIRIEDNVVIRQEGPLNLTRAAFAELA